MTFNKKSFLIIIGAVIVVSFGFGVVYGQYLVKNTDLDIFKESIIAQADMEKNEQIIIDLKGAVETPGIYRLPAATRVGELLDQAKLMDNADTSSINLARKLTDEEVITVPYSQDEISEVNNSTNKNDSGNSFLQIEETDNSSTKININTASLELLETLPGIGPAKASAIINYRLDHGSFDSIEEIKNVSGIGEATFETLKELITVD